MMTNPATIQLKQISALLEAIDNEVPKEAELALPRIKTILESGEKTAK